MLKAIPAMKSLVLTSVLVILSSLSLHAVPICLLPWDHAVASRKLAVVHGTKTHAIEYMHPSARTEPVNISASVKNLQIIDTKQPNAADGTPLFIPVTLPPGVKNPLLLLIPDKKSPLGLRASVVEDDPTKFKWGSFSFINATGKELVLICDEKTIPLKPTTKPNLYSPGGKTRNLPVKIFLLTGPKKPLYTSVWAYEENLRQLVIIIPRKDKAKDGPVDFKFIIEDRRDSENAEP